MTDPAIAQSVLFLALGRELAESVIKRHRRRLRGRARRITIDLHPTDDPTRGAQQTDHVQQLLQQSGATCHCWPS